jgi:hypothetical protein
LLGVVFLARQCRARFLSLSLVAEGLILGFWLMNNSEAFVPHPLRQVFETNVWRWALAVALVTISIGCGRPEPVIPSVPALPPNDTPEGKLARVMQRLESALEDAQAATGSGVVSERKAYDRIIRPEKEGESYAAVITIETTRALAPIALNAKAKARSEAQAEKQGEERTDKDGKPLIVKDTLQTEIVEYPLLFQENRWILKDELPAGTTEHILFSYALDQ